MYRDYILDHYKNPRNSGALPGATNSYHDTNPLCGDEITMSLLIDDDVVKDVRFQGKGCAISQASASIISDELIGKTVTEVAALDRNFVAEELGLELSPTRLKCGLLGLKVVQGALLGTDEWPTGTPDDDPAAEDVARLRSEI